MKHLNLMKNSNLFLLLITLVLSPLLYGDDTLEPYTKVDAYEVSHFDCHDLILAKVNKTFPDTKLLSNDCGEKVLCQKVEVISVKGGAPRIAWAPPGAPLKGTVLVASTFKRGDTAHLKWVVIQKANRWITSSPSVFTFFPDSD